MATGTLAPWFDSQLSDDNGDPLSGGFLYTYIAGTTTNLATYSDPDLAPGHANANPIVLDSAGRTGAIYLSAAAYKFVLKNSTGGTIKTQDNIQANAPFNVATDITGTAGESLTAGDVVYISDGSGGATAGRWYKADADFTYSSSSAGIIGVVPVAIASAASGAIRLQGSITGLAGLVSGTVYYVSATAGGLTSSAPANARFVGVADSTTTIVLAPSLVGAAALMNFNNPGSFTVVATGAVGLSVINNTTSAVVQTSGTGIDTLQMVSAATGASIIKNVTNSNLLFGTNNLTRFKLLAGGNIEMASGNTITMVAGADLILDIPTGRSLLTKVNGTTKVTTDSSGNMSLAGTGTQLTLSPGSGNATVQLAGNAGDTLQLVAAGAGTSILKNVSNSALLLGANNAEVIRLDVTGSVQLGGSAVRAGTAGTKRLDIFDGTAPTSTLAAGISLYSTAGELRVMDAAGNATLLSPHDHDSNEWIFDSVQTVTGHRLRIDVERLLRAVNDHLGGGYVHEDAA